MPTGTRLGLLRLSCAGSMSYRVVPHSIKTERDIFHRKRLAELALKHPQRFEVLLPASWTVSRFFVQRTAADEGPVPAQMWQE